MTKGVLHVLAAMAASLSGACQSTGDMTSAVMTSANDESMSALHAALAKAMGTAQVTLGASDVTQNSTLSVLPPRPSPHETHSLAMTTQFELMTSGGRCFVVRDGTGEAFEVRGAGCQAVTE